MLQLGLVPSHFSLRFLQMIHARRLSFEAPMPPPLPSLSVARSTPFLPVPAESESMMVSGSVPDDDDDDMLLSGDDGPRRQNCRLRKDRPRGGGGGRKETEKKERASVPQTGKQAGAGQE